MLMINLPSWLAHLQLGLAVSPDVRTDKLHRSLQQIYSFQKCIFQQKQNAIKTLAIKH